MRKNKLNSAYFDLTILIGIAVLTLFFWESSFIYPVKIFTVFLHEVSHAIVTVLTGGEVLSIKFTLHLSGVTITKGGQPILIAASGYLGSLVFGIFLFLSAGNEKLRIWYSTTLAIIILLVTINIVEGGLQKFLGLAISVIFFIFPRYLNNKVNYFFFKVLGTVSILYIIADIKQDLLTTTLRETDTQILEYLTGIPSAVVGFLWLFISIIALFFLFRYSIKK